MGTDLLFSRQGPELWAIRREENRVAEVWLDAPDPDRRAGNLLKLRTVNVLPGLQAAFLELAYEPNAYLNATDLTLPEERGGSADAGRRLERRLAEGRELMVRIDREEIDDKGPRIRSDLSLPGRHLVYFPYLKSPKVSRRVRSSEARERLLKMAGEWGHSGAYVFRTVAADAPTERIEAEARTLRARWESIEQAAKFQRAPAVLHREPDLHLRLLRDLDPSDFDRVVIDCEDDFREMVRFAEETAPEWIPVLQLHEVGRSIFEDFELGRELDRCIRRRVWLKSGGTLAIDETEAMVAIDVNTGRNLGRDSAVDTVERTNLEAAAEVARQVRLRDLGGVIVVDFIDMEDERARAAVVREVEIGLVGDPARSKVGRFSELGLLEISRSRRRANLRTLLSEEGRSLGVEGRRPNARRIAMEIYRLLLRDGGYGVMAHPEVIEEIRRARDRRIRSTIPLQELELRECGMPQREIFEILRHS